MFYLTSKALSNLLCELGERDERRALVDEERARAQRLVHGNQRVLAARRDNFASITPTCK